MTQPVLSSFAQTLYDSVQPLAQEDGQQGWALAYFCAALGEMFQIVEDYSRDQISHPSGGIVSYGTEKYGSGPYGSSEILAGENIILPGWSQVIDITRAPTEALPWLAQFVGVPLTTGISDAAQRAQIQAVAGWSRGTPGAMVAAAQATLTGNKTVTLLERDGDPYFLTVVTKASETPSTTVTLAALVSQKPAGIVLTYVNIDGQTYGQLLSTNAPTYALAFTTYTDYQHLLLND